ncbi:hypothetical protein ACHAXT_003067 [Thalassiosira profunda]
MEPTIRDESHTVILMERFSHRLFGLETKASKGERQISEQEDSDEFESNWRTLLRGMWEQHFTSGLQRGDVVILSHPEKEGTLCKRIIGMPGDTIVRTDGGGDECGHTTVPAGHLWIEGDNSLMSLDSRSYGSVPASLVVGKVVRRMWPLREYASLGLDGNGMEHLRRVDARIGRDERPVLAGGRRVAENRSYVLGRQED